MWDTIYEFISFKVTASLKFLAKVKTALSQDCVVDASKVVGMFAALILPSGYGVGGDRKCIRSLTIMWCGDR
jgi:hypothetical protein